MQFTVARDALLTPLQRVAGVVERRQTLPILANLLLQVEDRQLTVTATDQEVEVSFVIPLEAGSSPGEITVPGRKLADICRSLGSHADIECSLENYRLKLQSGRFTSHLATLPAIDFPRVEPAASDASVIVPAANFLDLLDKTHFAMAQQDVRYFFNGMLLGFDDNLLRAVATNGQRLAIRESPIDSSHRYQVIVPRKAITELAKLLKDAEGDVVLELSSHHLHVTQAGAVFTTSLIDAVYPDYTRAIPVTGDKVMVADRKELKEALSRISILSNEMYRNVRLQLSSSEVTLSANNPLQEEAEEKLGVTYQGEGIEIGFNVSYMIDVLNAIDGDNIQIRLSDSSSAFLITDPDDERSQYVISPMML